MSFVRTIRSRETIARQEQETRRRCYDAGYSNRPCPSPLAVCTTAWKRGREARERDGLTEAGSAAPRGDTGTPARGEPLTTASDVAPASVSSLEQDGLA